MDQTWTSTVESMINDISEGSFSAHTVAATMRMMLSAMATMHADIHELKQGRGKADAETAAEPAAAPKRGQGALCTSRSGATVKNPKPLVYSGLPSPAPAT